ncbi:MAG: hypothetical protein ACFFEF_12690 [Candidatus Thorarchaeota archaeon]
MKGISSSARWDTITSFYEWENEFSAKANIPKGGIMRDLQLRILTVAYLIVILLTPALYEAF